MTIAELEREFKSALVSSLRQERATGRMDLEFLIIESLVTGYLSSESINALGVINWLSLMRPRQKMSDGGVIEEEIILTDHSIDFKDDLYSLQSDSIPGRLIIYWIQEVLGMLGRFPGEKEKSV